MLSELVKIDPEYLYEYVKENEFDTVNTLAMNFLKWNSVIFKNKKLSIHYIQI